MVEGFDEDLRTALWGRNSPAGMLIRKRTLRPLEGGIGLLKNDDEKGAIGMLKWRALLVAVVLSVFVACPAMAADANESADTVLDNAVHEGFVSEDENVNAALAVAQRVHDAFVASFEGDFFSWIKMIPPAIIFISRWKGAMPGAATALAATISPIKKARPMWMATIW